MRATPAASGFSSSESDDAFERTGRTITAELRRELRDKATVRYWRDPN